jgi:serine/threonine-protein kinase HipA
MPSFKKLQKVSVSLRFSPGCDMAVGLLAMLNGRVAFQFSKDFVKSGLQISPLTLPLMEQPTFAPIGRYSQGLPFVLAESLSDGWGRLVVDRFLGERGISPSEVGPLDRLALIGSRGMGALVYSPDLTETDRDTDTLDLGSLLAGVEQINEGKAVEVLPKLAKLGGSPGGARPKILAGIDENDRVISGTEDMPAGYVPCILKFPVKSEILGRYECETEYAYSCMARLARITIPETRLLQVGKQKAFCIQRFDRVQGVSSDRKTFGDRLHQHTLGGLLGMEPGHSVCDYKHLLSVALRLTGDKRNILSLFRQMVFNIATHNRDDHARNFSFMMDIHGTWHVSPAYDLLYSAGPAGEHSTSVMGECKKPEWQNIVSLGEEFGLSMSEMTNVIQEVGSAVQQWGELAKLSGIPKALSETISKNFQDIHSPKKRAKNTNTGHYEY